MTCTPYIIDTCVSTLWRGAILVLAGNGKNLLKYPAACYTIPQPAPHTGISKLETNVPNHNTQAHKRCTTKFHTSENSALDGEWSGSASGRCTLKSHRNAMTKLKGGPQSSSDVVVRTETGIHSSRSANTLLQCFLTFLPSSNS